MPFRDRKDAGNQLGHELLSRGYSDALVIALPRGGVTVAFEVARLLSAPLDVLVVRKIGAPDNPEYGIGAVAEDEIPWLDSRAMATLGLTEAEIAPVIENERRELRRRVKHYRGGLSLPSLKGRRVLLVDDGLATGVTALVAARFLKRQGAGEIILAVPVGAPDSVRRLRGEVDEVVCLEAPERFYAVGAWYEDFAQVDDGTVVDLLEKAEEFRKNSRARVPIARDFEIRDGSAYLRGHLEVPPDCLGIVLFAHGSGSSRLSPRNLEVASTLNRHGIGTVLFDLLTPGEALDRRLVFDIPLLARRLQVATAWIERQSDLKGLMLGYFGASTGAAAALWAASEQGTKVKVVVSRGGRPDLALPRLREVKAPTLLIVGGADEGVIELNQTALRYLDHGELILVPGATHLFQEEGALEAVADLAVSFFSRHFREGRSRAVA